MNRSDHISEESNMADITSKYNGNLRAQVYKMSNDENSFGSIP